MDTKLSYQLPVGSSEDSFSEMNSRYMKEHFKDWQTGRSYLIPPVPYSKYPEPLHTGTAAQVAGSGLDTEYRFMRTAQKSESDELAVYRTLEQFAFETGRSMFVFHTFRFNRPQQDAFLRIFHQAAVDKAIDLPRKLDHVLKTNARGVRNNLEMDFLVVDKQVGLVVIEVKGKDFCRQPDERSNVQGKINKAGQQLSKDDQLLQVIWSVGGNGARLPITQVAALVEDEQPAEALVLRGSARAVAFREHLASASRFQRWWGANVEQRASPEHAAVIYTHLVPVLIGLSVAFAAAGLRPDETPLPLLRPSDLLSDRDVQVDRQILSSRFPSKLPLTNVHMSQKNSVFRSDKSVSVVYLTPDQWQCHQAPSTVRIIEGAAGVGKTLVIMFKLLEVAREQPALVLCRGAFLWKYHRFLINNGIAATVLINEQSVKNPNSCANSVQSLFECSPVSDAEVRISVAPQPYQVALCDITDFVNAAIVRRYRLLAKRRIAAKQNNATLTEIKQLTLKLTWQQSLNVFVDDADLQIFVDWDGLLTDMNPKLCTWIAFDHAQTLSKHWLEGHADGNHLRHQLRERVHQLGGMWLQLGEVMRNSVEIIKLNEALARQILSIHGVRDAPMPAVGHNIVCGSIQVLELYDGEFWSAEASDNEEQCEKALAAFLEFVLTEIVLPSADRHRTAVLTIGNEPNFIRVLGSHLARSFMPTAINYYAQQPDLGAEGIVVDNSAESKSFEWQQVVVVIPLQAGRALNRATVNFQEALRSCFWLDFYQCATRPRTRLYLVGPPVVWKAYLKPLGVPPQLLLRRSFAPHNHRFVQVPKTSLPLSHEDRRLLGRLGEMLREKYAFSTL